MFVMKVCLDSRSILVDLPIFPPTAPLAAPPPQKSNEYIHIDFCLRNCPIEGIMDLETTL